MRDVEKRDTVQKEFYGQAGAMGLPYEYCHTLVVDSMTDEIVRLRAILAALREPSESIMHTAYLASFQHTLFERAWTATLCAAVTAAEQEVEDAR